MRKVKLPEVTKEEAEATFMVLFTAPLKRLGLVNTHTHKQTIKLVLQREHYAHKIRSSGEEHHCFRGECYQCVYDCMYVCV